MTTEARILANRLNAQKSTGPQTPQGKAVVSQNALKHGLSARHDVITTESQGDFDLHRDALLAELDPIGPMESILADRIVSLSWRLKRADLIQNQTFDALNEKNTNNPLANLAKSFGLKGFAAPQPDPSDSTPDLTLGRIALKDFSNARVLDRLLMYERRIEHSLYKTILELQRLRLLKTLEHPNAAPPFSRRRHACPERSRRDDALTPNSTPHDGIPIHQDPISQIRPGGINNQSSIVNIQSPPVAERIENQESSIEYPPLSIEYQESSIIAQNKPNVKMGKMTISPATTKPYLNEQQTMNNERCSKQTQSNPIPPSRESPAIRNTRYEIQTQSTRAGTRYAIRHPTCKTTSPKRKPRGILGQFPDGHTDRINL